MPSSTNYDSNIVDVPLLGSLIGTDWATEAVMAKSGAMAIDSRPIGTGSTIINIRRKIFEGSSAQAPDTDGELSFVDVNDTKFNAPIVVRAYGANMFSLQAEMSVNGVFDYPQIAMEIREAIVRAIDTTAVKVVEGCAASNTGNQSGSATTLSATALNTAAFVRGDKGNAFVGGVMLMRSELALGLKNLGLIANPTIGFDLQNSIATNGMISSLLGMYPYISNEVSLVSAGVHYAYLMEKGAVVFRGGMAPIIEVSPIPKGLGKYLKVYCRFAIGIRNMSFIGTAADNFSDTELATSGNWELKGLNAASVPLVRWHTNAT
jgi:hypothetical protein